MLTLKGSKSQLSTEEANLSRKITKIRWVVEAVHGNIAQKNKLLHHSFHDKMLPKLELLCKITDFCTTLMKKTQFGWWIKRDYSTIYEKWNEPREYFESRSAKSAL